MIKCLKARRHMIDGYGATTGHDVEQYLMKDWRRICSKYSCDFSFMHYREF